MQNAQWPFSLERFLGEQCECLVGKLRFWNGLFSVQFEPINTLVIIKWSVCMLFYPLFVKFSLTYRCHDVSVKGLVKSERKQQDKNWLNYEVLCFKPRAKIYKQKIWLIWEVSRKMQWRYIFNNLHLLTDMFHDGCDPLVHLVHF